MSEEIAAATLQDGVVVDRHMHVDAEVSRSKLGENTMQLFPFNLLDLRVWDALDKVLPGSGNLESAEVGATTFWDPNTADETFFTAVRAYRVLGITSRVEVAGTDAGAVSGAIKKAASGTDIASGTALHSGTINLKGTVDTNQVLTLSATSSDLDIAAGTSIGIDVTGTMTAARGTVTVLLAPAGSADDLLLVTGTFASAAPRVKTGDVKALGAVTKYARAILQLPDNYDTKGTPGNVGIRCFAGMETTVADTTATIVVAAYQIKSDGTLSGNLVTTSATSINSTTLANYDFVVTPTTLAPGDLLDVRVAIAVNDAAGVAVVQGVLAKLFLRCDCRP